MNQEDKDYTPYCPDCQSCGEDGCCPPTQCKFTETGHYCEINLKKLKIAYKLLDYIYDMQWLTDDELDTLSVVEEELYSKYFNNEQDNQD